MVYFDIFEAGVVTLVFVFIFALSYYFNKKTKVDNVDQCQGCQSPFCGHNKLEEVGEDENTISN